MKQFLVTVQCSIAGKYTLPLIEYRVNGSSPTIAVSRAWRMYKRQPSLKRRRLDNYIFHVYNT